MLEILGSARFGIRIAGIVNAVLIPGKVDRLRVNYRCVPSFLDYPRETCDVDETLGNELR